MRGRDFGKWLLWGAGLYVLDRIIKLLISQTGWVWAGPGFFIRSALNQHAVFSWPMSQIWQLSLGFLSLLFLGYIGYTITANYDRRALVGLILMMAGGLSNMLDRWQGGVVDVFYLPVGLFFNLSDIYLIVGLAMFICYNWNKKKFGFKV